MEDVQLTGNLETLDSVRLPFSPRLHFFFKESPKAGGNPLGGAVLPAVIVADHWDAALPAMSACLLRERLPFSEPECNLS